VDGPPSCDPAAIGPSTDPGTAWIGKGEEKQPSRSTGRGVNPGARRRARNVVGNGHA